MHHITIDDDCCFRGSTLELGLDAHLHIYPDYMVITRPPLPEAGRNPDGSTMAQCTAVIETQTASRRMRQAAAHSAPPAQGGGSGNGSSRAPLLRRLSQTIIALVRQGARQLGPALGEWVPTEAQVRACDNRHLASTKFVRRIVAGGTSTITFHASERPCTLLWHPHVVLEVGDAAELKAADAALPRLYLQVEGEAAVHLARSRLGRGSIVTLSGEAVLELDRATTASLAGSAKKEGKGSKGSKGSKGIGLHVVRTATARVALAGEPGQFPPGYREAGADTPGGRKYAQRVREAARHARGWTTATARRPSAKRARPSAPAPGQRATKRVRR